MSSPSLFLIILPPQPTCHRHRHRSGATTTTTSPASLLCSKPVLDLDLWKEFRRKTQIKEAFPCSFEALPPNLISLSTNHKPLSLSLSLSLSHTHITQPMSSISLSTFISSVARSTHSSSRN
ncbi:hypothetical protein Hanom_Chr07g00633681 [Helianthus anomalus]